MFQLFKNGQKKCPKIDFPKKSCQNDFVDTTPVGKFYTSNLSFSLHYVVLLTAAGKHPTIPDIQLDIKLDMRSLYPMWM